MAEVRQLSQSVEKFKAREAVSEAERFLFSGHDVGGLKVLTATVPEADANRLRKMGDFLRDKAAQGGGRAGRRQRGEDHLPGRVRQGCREGRREGRGHHQAGVRHRRRLAAAVSPTPPWAAVKIP